MWPLFPRLVSGYLAVSSPAWALLEKVVEFLWGEGRERERVTETEICSWPVFFCGLCSGVLRPSPSRTTGVGPGMPGTIRGRKPAQKPLVTT